MTTRTLRFLPVLAAVLLGILLFAPHVGRGEDASSALDEYARYLPGNPVPGDLSCRTMMGFYEVETQMACHADGGSYCDFGRVIANHGVITQATFYRCNFPLAYLTAQYGRYDQIRRYSQTIILRWHGVSANVRRTGLFHLMQSVYVVTWWKPLHPNQASY